MSTPVRYLTWASLACAALELGLALVTNQGGPWAVASVFILAPVMLLWVCLVIAAAVAAVISLARKRWAEAVALPFIPLVACFATLNVTPYVEYPQDYIHFRMMRSSYEATIARQPADGHRFAEFNWGGMLFASKGVVYDETDEVRLPYGHQSADWKRRMRATDLTCRGDGPIGDVRPLGDHYYVTSFGC